MTETASPPDPNEEEKPKKWGKPPEGEPDYGSTCDVCGAFPVVPATGMCGPCSFGEASTAGGDW